MLTMFNLKQTRNVRRLSTNLHLPSAAFHLFSIAGLQAVTTLFPHSRETRPSNRPLDRPV
ncbi:hypothetical protein BDV32DRAFT_124578 [Aspergillus pseudonomiae]|nr:hypothetical protein BDV32DRAFT_124578 [Aspergillus pseudonomiae]